MFNVVDYKSGRPPRFNLEDVQSGRSLQLALYTLAALRFELAGESAKPFQMGYWSLRESGFVTGIKGGRKNQISAIDIPNQLYTVTAALGVASGAGGMLAVANPLGKTGLVMGVDINIVTASTPAVTLDCGVAANATTSADTFIDLGNLQATNDLTSFMWMKAECDEP